MEQEFTEQFKHSLENIAQQFYNTFYKEIKKVIKGEGQDYQTGFEQGIAQAKKQLYEHFPMWKVAPADDYTRETILAGCGEFGMRVLHRGQLIKEGWKYIPIRSLKMLPTEIDTTDIKNEE